MAIFKKVKDWIILLPKIILGKGGYWIGQFIGPIFWAKVWEGQLVRKGLGPKFFLKGRFKEGGLNPKAGPWVINLLKILGLGRFPFSQFPLKVGTNLLGGGQKFGGLGPRIFHFRLKKEGFPKFWALKFFIPFPTGFNRNQEPGTPFGHILDLLV